VCRGSWYATASFTLNVYSHMIPREHDPSGDRLASLVFGNKMETVADLPTQTRAAERRKLEQISLVRSQDFGDTPAEAFLARSRS
jgi:hypothetical protein